MKNRIAIISIATIALLAGLAITPAWALTATEVQKLLASDGTAGDQLGWSVAVHGDTAVIGALLDDDNGTDSGAAYIFVRSGTSWSEQAKLTASDAAAGDNFGHSVAVHGDTAVIGAQVDDGNGSDSSKAYIFVRSGTSWSEQAKLSASDAAVGDRFGNSVAVHNDTAVIGAFLSDDPFNSGAAYVFVRSDTSWSEQAKLTASDGAANDWFGWSVAVHGDTAVIGAQNAFGIIDSGAAYVFVRSGTNWGQQAKLTASDGPIENRFGSSVSVHGDTAMIGATKGDGHVSDSGAAYVFVRSDTSWSEQAKLTASDGADFDRFGGSVAVHGDTAVIGAHNSDGNVSDSGSAYAFVRTGTSWSEQAKLSASDGAAVDNFGASVALHGDTAVIGAYWDDDNGFQSGSAYVFSLLSNVNGLVTFEPDPETFSTTSDTTGCPAGYVGKFSFESTLTNISADTLTYLQVEVETLTRRNLLLTDEGLIGEGEFFPVPEVGGYYSDGILSPGEFVDVPFSVCLRRNRPFQLFVNVLGAILNQEGIASAAAATGTAGAARNKDKPINLGKFVPRRHWFKQ